MHYPIISHGRRRRSVRRPLPAALIAAIFLPSVCAAQATTYETLYSFQGDPDGAQPKAAVVIGKDGALYGTTYTGGTSESGTVFKLAPSTGVPWSETVLHSFAGPDGLYPNAALALATGALYGSTSHGGTGAGTIFELTPPATAGDAWTETILYAFTNGGFSDHSQDVIPNGPLLMAPGGTLFTTTYGFATGISGIPAGALVAVVPPATPTGDWTEYKLYTFGSSSGYWVFAGVVSQGGSLFGTTSIGGDESCGAFGCGTVYELTPAAQGATWAETTIHNFGGSPGDGTGPVAALTLGPEGVLYGTTPYGGSGLCVDGAGDGCGTVFQLTPPTAPGATWTESVIYSFAGTDGDGAVPVSSVVLGKNGILYGTTQYGGNATSACPSSYFVLAGCGTVFELTPPASGEGTWTEKVLHSFSDANGDGSMPVAGLAISPAGVLYGTTSAGGTAGKGTVFAIVP